MALANCRLLLAELFSSGHAAHEADTSPAPLPSSGQLLRDESSVSSNLGRENIRASPSGDHERASLPDEEGHRGTSALRNSKKRKL